MVTPVKIEATKLKIRATSSLIKWHLPLMFVVALIFGYFCPDPGKFLNDTDLIGICFAVDSGKADSTCVFNTLGNHCVTIIFVISGINLQTAEMKSAVGEWKAVLFGIVSILFLSPMLSFWIILWEFKTPEFAVGLSLFFTQATTLSSGPIIVGQAKGNVSLALLLTLSTNILSVATMPLFVVRFIDTYSTIQEPEETNISSDVDLELSPVPIILQLVFTLLIPLFIGKSLRVFDGVKEFAEKFKISLKLISSFLIAMTVWMSISGSAQDLRQIDVKSIIVQFIVALGLHIVLLIFNYSFTTYIVPMPQEEKRAVVISTSQKTLSVAITVLGLLDENLVGSRGLATIPIIIAQFIQIIFDAFLAAFWAGRPLDVKLYSEHEANDEHLPTSIEHEPKSQFIREEHKSLTIS